jgi:hypothetical protein
MYCTRPSNTAPFEVSCSGALRLPRSRVARALRERPPGRVVVNIDPHTSIFYARRTLELAVAWLYKFNRNLRLSYQL